MTRFRVTMPYFLNIDVEVEVEGDDVDDDAIIQIWEDKYRNLPVADVLALIKEDNTYIEADWDGPAIHEIRTATPDGK